MMKHFSYNYDNYQDDLVEVVYNIEKANKTYDLIVGIVRGGLVLGVHLSNILDAPFIALNWSSNISRVRDKENEIILTALAKKQNVLFVDDICDSGVTFDDVTRIYHGGDTACLIYNNINKRNFKPTYFGWEIDRNETPEWIDFWWEKK